MAGKGKGKGSGAGSYDRQISCLRYTLICFTIIVLAIGIAVLALSVWMLLDPSFQDWISMLEVPQYYIGVYVLLIGSFIVVAVAVFGCLGIFNENSKLLYVFVVLQVVCFICQLAGAAVLLSFGTRNSAIQPLMRKTLRRYIMDSYNSDSVEKLRLIQETIGCCGADGASDYIALKKPLPSECRDTVTGNAFFYGCVEEFTSFLEDKAAWLAALALTLCLLQAVDVVMTIILIRVMKREEEAITGFKVEMN